MLSGSRLLSVVPPGRPLSLPTSQTGWNKITQNTNKADVRVSAPLCVVLQTCPVLHCGLITSLLPPSLCVFQCFPCFPALKSCISKNSTCSCWLQNRTRIFAMGKPQRRVPSASQAAGRLSEGRKRICCCFTKKIRMVGTCLCSKPVVSKSEWKQHIRRKEKRGPRVMRFCKHNYLTIINAIHTRASILRSDKYEYIKRN